MYSWKETEEETREFNSTKAYVTNDGLDAEF
jgi:hypothetical protein